ncbi:DUF4145 domain-containing protein [Bradyrhizobium rifense]|uniref:DUF4145 domain-containing protein n=2 Tax=Bradyrhizobium rifense TaxID=515499 RepID=A0A5D3K8R8_9BRAD|nr:DUF4145 domain-containing protein [Bradyrhizobium rifense]
MIPSSVSALRAIKQLKKHSIVMLDAEDHGFEADNALLNVHVSKCFSCEGLSIWIKDALIWPASNAGVQPHDDMPSDVKEDFVEAASIVDHSPRGAAALARLAIQKLMIDLGEKGKNINDDIKALVRKGLDTEIQQALDIVRVIGNNAVHPGQVDLKDDRATATTLLSLVNLVVERRIASQKRIEEMFNNLPPSVRDAISKRDGKD